MTRAEKACQGQTLLLGVSDDRKRIFKRYLKLGGIRIAAEQVSGKLGGAVQTMLQRLDVVLQKEHFRLKEKLIQVTTDS
jgi:hypothetical protein